MKCILNNITDTYFNLAAEEYMLKYSNDDYIMIWISDPSIIIGKHQNAFAEINPFEVFNKGVNIARRLSGGGTVYHDTGNINFSFILNGEQGKLVDFGRHIKHVVDFLASIGIKAVQGSKNEIIAGGKKISGNAEHVYKNRVLHHGTLLYNSNLDKLNRYINRNYGIYNDRAVQSNRTTVVNLSSLLSNPPEVNKFKSNMYNFFMESFKGTAYDFDTNELYHINELACSRYKTREWIFGWSPQYSYENRIFAGREVYKLSLNVKKGIIESFNLYYPDMEAWYGKIISETFTGKEHHPKVFDEILKNLGFHTRISQKDWQPFLYSFF